MAELEGLRVVEGREGGSRGLGGIVGLVSAVREYLEELEVWYVFGALAESLDLRRLEELGEDVGVRV